MRPSILVRTNIQRRLQSPIYKQPRRFMTTQQKPTWKQNGTPEIVIGTTLLTLLGIDYYLQKQQDASRKDIMVSLQSAIKHDETEKDTARETDLEKEKDMDKLFDCIVRRIPKYFDGSRCLMGVEVGDQVSILEEGVGPDGMYHLCRMQKAESDAPVVGWFPTSCLEKLI